MLRRFERSRGHLTVLPRCRAARLPALQSVPCLRNESGSRHWQCPTRLHERTSIGAAVKRLFAFFTVCQTRREFVEIPMIPSLSARHLARFFFYIYRSFFFFVRVFLFSFLYRARSKCGRIARRYITQIPKSRCDWAALFAFFFLAGTSRCCCCCWSSGCRTLSVSKSVVGASGSARFQVCIFCRDGRTTTKTRPLRNYLHFLPGKRRLVRRQTLRMNRNTECRAFFCCIAIDYRDAAQWRRAMTDLRLEPS